MLSATGRNPVVLVAAGVVALGALLVTWRVTAPRRRWAVIVALLGIGPLYVGYRDHQLAWLGVAIACGLVSIALRRGSD